MENTHERPAGQRHHSGLQRWKVSGRDPRQRPGSDLTGLRDRRVNDGSTHDTADVLRKYVDAGKVRFFEQKNQGASAQRNACIRHARRELLAAIDADVVAPCEAREADRRPPGGRGVLRYH
ncbi:MAG: glycosyltransferase family 2 protein [Akkermansiaceae bacterium]|nr:glycosyltransferase family 2 protein [Akkermansiaceae bacterium]